MSQYYLYSKADCCHVDRDYAPEYSSIEFNMSGSNCRNFYLQVYKKSLLNHLPKLSRLMSVDSYSK